MVLFGLHNNPFHHRRLKVSRNGAKLIIALMLILIWIVDKNNQTNKISKGDQDAAYDISCYVEKDDYFNVTADATFRFPKKNIFFLMTSCLGELGFRGACAVESAARANPAYTVSVLFTGPLKPSSRNDTLLMHLRSMENVQLVRLDVNKFIEGSPLETIIKSGALQRSLYPVTHLSDVLKWVILSRWGGVFLAPWVVVAGGFERLPACFVGRDWLEGLELVNAGRAALAADTSRAGRRFTHLAVRLLRGSYSPTSWGGSGPELVLRVLHRLCSTRDKHNMSRHTCGGFEVLDHNIVTPVPLDYWSAYGGAASAEYAATLSHGAVVHAAWAPPAAPPPPPAALYRRLAQEHCPAVHALYNFTAAAPVQF